MVYLLPRCYCSYNSHAMKGSFSVECHDVVVNIVCYKQRHLLNIFNQYIGSDQTSSIILKSLSFPIRGAKPRHRENINQEPGLAIVQTVRNIGNIFSSLQGSRYFIKWCIRKFFDISIGSRDIGGIFNGWTSIHCHIMMTLT